MQMPPESVGICGILALDLPMGYLQGGDADLPGLPPGWRCRFAWVTSRVAMQICLGYLQGGDSFEHEQRSDRQFSQAEMS